MIWFTSDTHFGCPGLVRAARKQFSSVEEHDGYLIDSINHSVARRDTLFIVGDFCKGHPIKWRQRIRCSHIFFALGNHDHKGKTIQTFGSNRVFQEKTICIPGTKTKIVVSHYPIAFWDNCFRGRYHAYGHLHNDARREAMMDLGMPGRRSMDIGVDSAKARLGEYRPFSIEEFFDCLQSAPGHDIITEEERW